MTVCNPIDYHCEKAKQLVPEFGFELGTDFAEWRDELRGKLAESLGIPDRPSNPPEAKIIWSREIPAAAVDKIEIEAEPGFRSPAYVCIPHDASPPYAWMICLQGHSTGMHNSIGLLEDESGLQSSIRNDRDIANFCLRRGIAVLCLEQRGFGELKDPMLLEGRPHDMCRNPALQALMLGRTLLGERVYDVARALDFLKTRDDVDWRAVGVTGNSAGGTVSIFVHALLPGITFSMPSCCFYSFRESMINRTRRCICGYVPGILGLCEVHDVLGLAAPSPVVILAGKDDFDLEQVAHSFAELREIYRAAGAEESCHLVLGDGGHRYYADAGWDILMPELNKLRSC